jgi:hypothetical protein
MASRAKQGTRNRNEADGGTRQRWWIDQGKPREAAPRGEATTALAGAAFFRAGIGYDQETARSRLTDLNMKLLAEGAPPADGWAHLQMTEERFPARRFEQIQRAVPLGPGVHALAVDSGVSLRVLLTGDPRGERLIELRFGEESSFDAWIRGDWVEEALFQRFADALRAAPDFVRRHLPQGREPVPERM